MFKRFFPRLQNVPITDPILRRQTAAIQIILVTLIISGFAMFVTSFAIAQNFYNFYLYQAGLLTLIVGSATAWVCYSRGLMKFAAWLTMATLNLGLGLCCITLGLHYATGVLSALLLPIIIAGMLAERRGLLFTVPTMIIIVIIAAYFQVNWPYSIGIKRPSVVQTSLGFSFVAIITGFVIFHFIGSQRKLLQDALQREHDLQNIQISLQTYAAELAQAKRNLEYELHRRRQVEVELHQEHNLLYALMNNIPDLIAYKDQNARYIRANRAQAEMLGLEDPDDAIGKTDVDLLGSTFSQYLFIEDRQIINSGQAILDRIEFNPKSDGQPRWFTASKVPIFDQDDQVIGIISIARDITNRHEVDIMKNEFISVVSHELRTPLTSIRGSLGLLLGNTAGDLTPQTRSMLDIAYRNTERLLTLINDLLDMEKIEAGQLNFVYAPNNLLALLEHTIEMNSGYAAQFEVTFQIVEAENDIMVYVDSNRLIQVFTNILSNAAKFSPQGGTIDISVKRHEELFARVSITDHGPGIPTAFHQHIFEKFSQADASTTRQRGGTGLGLSIAKSIIEQLGGSISFETKLNEGTTFHIDLFEWRDDLLESTYD
jgi:PAS domain S-box-containing protein